MRWACILLLAAACMAVAGCSTAPTTVKLLATATPTAALPEPLPVISIATELPAKFTLYALVSPM